MGAQNKQHHSKEYGTLLFSSHRLETELTTSREEKNQILKWEDKGTYFGLTLTRLAALLESED